MSEDGLVEDMEEITPPEQRLDAAEDARWKNEERFRAVYEHAPVGIEQVGQDGRLLEVNPKLCAMLGYTREELLERTFAEITHADDRVAETPQIARLLAGEVARYTIEKRYLHKNGEPVWVRLTSSLAGTSGAPGTSRISVVEDITERKQLEEKLRQQAEELAKANQLAHTLAENAAAALYLYDADGRVTFMNPAAEAMFGWTREETLGKTLHDLIHYKHPDGTPYPMSECPLRTVMTEGKKVVQHEDLFIHKDGSWVPVSCSNAPVFSEGRIAGAVLVAHDISERKRAEEELRHSQEWFATTLQSIGDAVIATDATGRVTFLNPVAESLTGWQQEEAQGRHLPEVFRIVNEQRREAAENPVTKVLREGSIVGLANHTILIARNGREIPIDDSGAPIRAGSGSVLGAVLVFRDITDRRRAEEARRESEERLRLFIEHAPAAIAMFDRQMRYLAVSRRWLADYGLDGQDIVGRSHYEVFPEVPDRWRAIHQKCLAGAVERCAEDPFERVDGTLQWVRWEIHPWQRGDGEIGGIILFTEEITERKRADEALRQSEERLAGIIGAAMDAIITTDEEQRIVVFNAAAERMFRCCTAEVLGQPIERFIPPRLRAIHRDHIRHFSQTGVTSRSMTSPGTLTAVRADGEEFPIEATISQVTVGDQRLFTVILRDVTERQQMEEALRRHVEELAHANRAKDEFLAMLAHELRNPLGAVTNALQVMRMSDPARPAWQRAMDVVGRQVKHQARLVDDLLDVSRITQGKIHLRAEPIDLARLVREATEDHSRALEEAGLTHTVELGQQPIWVTGDPTRLAQIVGNLLQNSLKFTERGGHVTVRVTVDKADRRAAVAVRDTGVGIEPEMLPRVFDVFAQADRTLHRSPGGLGLGLALVKGLVELQGGEVRAASEGRGWGAEFTFFLPLADTTAVPADAAAPSDTDAERVRVLIVEDNRDAADALRDMLELSGYTVHVAYSGTAGLEAARQFWPDVVLCDLGLPGMDGYAVAAALRQDPATASIHLVAVSGYGQEEDQRRSREAGFDRHLTKPVDPAEMERVLVSASFSL
jgi:PAS domain S-box-containing protein